ncbi:hypothetical protein B1756_08655 [Natrarchaeobaculum aegyptiacum]|uniref:Uncharacterized protein n=1 Tax=Natrarchaeobaculum aegyptiacum TaxID=745377 RepID=A0A2Z2HSQ9_9EURY|nr:hypothetical protein B1756_08655 [Natrarchaeobaculum aegyptiacum]
MAAIATIFATVVGVTVLAIGADALLPGIVAAVAGCLLTGLVTAANRRTPGGRAVGGVLTVLAAVSLTGAIGLAALEGGEPFALIARSAVVVTIALAAFGATATVTGAIGDGAVRAAIPIAVATSIPIAVVSALYTEALRSIWLERDVGGVDANTVTGPLLTPEPGTGALVTFVLVLTGTLWLVSVVVSRLPIPDLVPRDRREDARERIAAIRSATRWSGLAALSFGLAIAATIAVADSIVETVEDHADSYASQVELALEGLESLSIALAATPALRLPLVAIVATFVVLYAVSRLPILHRVRHSRLLPWLPVFTGGAIVALVLIAAYPPVFESMLRPALADLGFASREDGLEEPASLLAPPNGVAVAAVATTAVVGLVTGVLGSIWLTGAVALLPDRAAPGALGAGALVLGSVFVALGGATTLVIVLPVACAIVAWDAASYGVAITDELARDAPVRRPALVHVTGTAVVAAVSVAFVLGLRVAAQAVTVQTGITIVLSLTVALLAVWIVLKRRAVRTGRVAEPDAGGRSAGDPRPVTSTTIPVLDDVEARNLRATGFETVGDLEAATPEEISRIGQIEPRKAEAIDRALRDLRRDRELLGDSPDPADSTGPTDPENETNWQN